MWRIRGKLCLPPVGHAPDGIADVVGDEQAAVGGDGEAGGAAPDLRGLRAADPKAGEEVLVAAGGPAVLEGYAHDLVAGRLRGVPGTVERHESVAAILDRELLAL